MLNDLAKKKVIGDVVKRAPQPFKPAPSVGDFKNPGLPSQKPLPVKPVDPGFNMPKPIPTPIRPIDPKPNFPIKKPVPGKPMPQPKKPIWDNYKKILPTPSPEDMKRKYTNEIVNKAKQQVKKTPAVKPIKL